MKERINKILHALNDGLFERETAVKLALLTTLAGESMFLFGAPGVAKSLIARRIKSIFRNGTSFEYLMNRFSTPDEIFGPIAISKLKNEDKYERVTERYLPTADIVFLDEIWKAGPSIQNSLLTVINEKVYRNGSHEVKIPLKGLLAASNELPQKGEGLGALWDRFIVRYWVRNIKSKGKFNDFLAKENIDENVKISTTLKITEAEFRKWQKGISKIKISDQVYNIINVIRHYISKYNQNDNDEESLYISDRRWKKIVKILKTSAFLNDRKEIDLMDCFLIAHMIWDKIEQIEVVKGFVEDAIINHAFGTSFDLSIIRKETNELEMEIESQTKKKKRVSYLKPIPVSMDNEVFYHVEEEERLIEGRAYTWSKSIFIKESKYLSLIKVDSWNLRPEFYNENCEKINANYNVAYASEPGTIILGKKGYYDNTIEEEKKFKLKSVKKTKTVTTKLTPPKTTIQLWNRKIKNLNQEINKSLKSSGAVKKKIDKTLKENLFVNRTLAKIIEQSLDQAISSLKRDQVKITMLKDKL